MFFHRLFLANTWKKNRGSPYSFKRKGEFIPLSSLVWAKSLTFCTCTRSCARADDAKSCAVGMRNAILRNYLKWKETVLNFVLGSFCNNITTESVENVWNTHLQLQTIYILIYNKTGALLFLVSKQSRDIQFTKCNLNVPWVLNFQSHSHECPIKYENPGTLLNPIQTGLFWSICDWGGASSDPPPPLYLWNQ